VVMDINLEVKKPPGPRVQGVEGFTRFVSGSYWLATY